MRTIELAALALIMFASYEASAAERSAFVRNAFIRTAPCPTAGSGTCAARGYEVEHTTALICGGRDVVENLSWLDKASHKVKSREDVRRCRGTFYGFMMRSWRLVRYWE